MQMWLGMAISFQTHTLPVPIDTRTRVPAGTHLPVLFPKLNTYENFGYIIEDNPLSSYRVSSLVQCPNPACGLDI
jgi:hypothetical protein